MIIDPSIQEPKRDEKGHFLKGVSGNPAGCPKGVKKRAQEVKEAFLATFDAIGGLKELVRWVRSHPAHRKEFYKMLLTILPKDITVEDEGKGTKIVVVYPPKGQDADKSETVSGRIPGESA